MTVKRSLADVNENKKPIPLPIRNSSIGIFFPSGELKPVLLLRAVTSPKIACVFWQVLSESDNPGNLWH